MISELRSAYESTSNASEILTEIERELGEIESAIATLPSKLKSLRHRGYIFLRYLDRSLDSLSANWVETSPPIQQAVRSLRDSSHFETENLQTEINKTEQRIRHSAIDSIHLYRQTTESLSSRAESLESRVTEDVEHLQTYLNRFAEGGSSIQRDISTIMKTLELTSQATSRLKEGENPLLALRARYLSGDRNDGVILLTDLRFIFEGEKDMVLERFWIIPTKKRKEKFVVAEAPIGSIDEIVKGRVGLLEWTGVYIKFKPDTDWEEMPFDVKGGEADTIIRLFNYLRDGDADIDKAELKGTASGRRNSTHTIVKCPHCGAPYSKEIYRGQISLRCEYCSFQISLK